MTFDIYCRSGNRWQLHSRFPPDQENRAIEEAEELDTRPGIDGVRVMTLKPGASKGDIEVMVWISPRLSGRVATPKQKKPKAPPSPAPAAPAPTSTAAAPAPPKPAAAEKPAVPAPAPAAPSSLEPTRSKRIKKIQEHARTAAYAAAAGAGAAVAAASVAGPLAAQGAALSPAMAKFLPFGAFAAVAAIVAAWLTRRRAAKSEAGAAPATAPSKTAKAKGSGPPDFTPSGAESADGTPAPELNIEPKSENAIETGPVDESHRLVMIRFIEGVIVAIKDAVPKLDAYNAFGLNLFLAGAAEYLANGLKLSAMQTFVMVREAIEAVGTSADMVESTTQKLPEYRADSKYRSMIECGRGAMESYLAQRPDPFGGLPGAFTVWNRRSAAHAHAQGIVVIMFTDIVGSTQMTQEHGDFGAQAAVRAHNAIVRGALAEHTGHEVKHTGDGIMASFFGAASAVAATMQIQREIARHNANTESMPLRVRIGLNAGETIQEEDDYFGHTVQLAARVCSKAEDGEIFVSEAVRTLTEGHDFQFVPKGDFELKGIEKPVPLFAVEWRPRVH